MMERHDNAPDRHDTEPAEHEAEGRDRTPREGDDHPARPSAVTAERHPFDALSLVFGLLFVTVAGFGLAGELRPVVVEGDWVGPVVLIGIGLALVLTIRRDR